MAVKVGTPAGTIVEARGQQYILRSDAEAGLNAGMANGGLSVAYVSPTGAPSMRTIGRTAARVVAPAGTPEAAAVVAQFWNTVDAHIAEGDESRARYWANPTLLASLPPRPARAASSVAQSGTGNS